MVASYTPSIPGPTNTFIPTMNEEATAGLVVNFSRNPRDFALPRWCTYTSPVKRWKGFYLRMTIDQCARVLDTKGNNCAWPRGADAPELTWNLESFGWMPFMTERFAYGYQLPDEAEQQGDFSPMTQNNAVEAQRAMTQRVQIGVTLATDTSQYDATHVDTATNWGGGYANAGTATDPIFKRMLETMYRRIHLDTRGVVKPSDMVVVMNPQTANLIAQGQEIHAYLKESPYALAQLKGREPGQNDTWGLPPFYAGFNIVIEDTVVNPNAKGATAQTGQYCWPWGTIAMFARPGGLIAPEGATSFSTIHLFLKEDMSVETFDDRINRRYTSRFVDDFGFTVVAPVSGCLATSVLASEPVAFAGGGLPGGSFPTQGAPGISANSTAELEEMKSQINQLSAFLEQLRGQNSRFEERNALLERENARLREDFDKLNKERAAEMDRDREERERRRK